MPKSLIKAVQQAATEARYWTYAAWTLPFVALALIIFEHFIGRDDWISVTLVGITTTFFSVSVYWWWWALSKIVKIIDGFKRTEQHFIDVKNELKETRKTIRGE